jgi:hypothetical protein
VWGLDLVRPLQKAPGGYTHLLVTVDKFSKWIEACPISKIKSDQAVLFFTASSLTKTHNSPAKNSLSYAMTTMSTWTGQ